MSAWTGPATLANKPHPLTARFVSWAHAVISQKIEAARPPEARPNLRYVSIIGSDSNDGLTPATAWRSLQKVQDFIDSLTPTQARDAAILFRRGDTWRFAESQGKASRSVNLTAGAQTSNTVTITSSPVGFQPVPGEMWLLSSAGAGNYNLVTAYNPATRVVTFAEACRGSAATTMGWEAALHVNQPVALGSFTDPALTDLAPPRFLYGEKLGGGAWTATANPKVWQYNTGGTTIARLKQAKNYDHCAWRVTTELEVRARENSWAQVGSTLFYRPREGEVPNSGVMGPVEIVPRNTLDGIVIADIDGAVLSDIWVDGYGAWGQFLGTYTGYSFIARATGSNTVVFRRCLSSQCHRHGIGNVVDAAGGIMVCEDCQADWNDEGAPFISYSSAGANECWLRGCSTMNTVAPFGVQPFTTQGAGFSQGYYSHTSGGSVKAGMCLSIGFREGPGEWMASSTSVWGDAPAWTDINDCRAFHIDYRYTSRTRGPIDDRYNPGSAGSLALPYGVGESNNAYLYSQVVGNMIGRNEGDLNIVENFRGAWISSRFEFNFNTPLVYGEPSSQWGTVKAVAANMPASTTFCTFRLNAGSGGRLGMITLIVHPSGSGTPSAGRHWNNVYDFRATGDSFLTEPDTGPRLSIGNGVGNPDRLKNNHYSGILQEAGARGFDSDPSPSVSASSSGGDCCAFRSTGSFPALFGRLPELDFLMRPRRVRGQAALGAAEMMS